MSRNKYAKELNLH